MPNIKTIEDLRNDPKNINKGTPRGHGIIERSVRQRGAGRSGLAARDGTILAGNQTLLKMAELGIPIRAVHTTGDEWVVVVRDDLDPESEAARLLAIEDNRASEVGYDPDPALLALLAQEVDLSHLYYEDELAAIIAAATPTDIGVAGDDFDVTPQDGPTRTALGDLWAIGPHRLLVGDCTDAANVARLMGGERAALAATDPPYNVRVDYGEATDDDKSEAEYQSFTGAWFAECQAVSERQIVTPGYENLIAWLRLFSPDHVAPWTKMNSMKRVSRVSTWSCWEPILFFGQKWRRDRAHDVFAFSSAVQHSIDGEAIDHPCPKPLSMWVDLYENYTDRGAVVYEPFAGSGTAIIAAHRTGRRAFGTEIEPRYADVILRRAEAEGLSCARVEP